ncbi:PREDICTED: plexin-B2 [Myotis davidii]|uniref:plexin-B2 n=1 Tax=Myotis davidii TaxID=225400 RepID=UPI0007676717|nr:PREDICTED: plexin-B2 [Myotis davidii]
MALQLWALTLLGLLGTGSGLRPRKLDSFQSKTELNHLVVDEASGVVYVGAVNALYQLSADLQLEQKVDTGPALDNKKCTPPIEISHGEQRMLFVGKGNGPYDNGVIVSTRLLDRVAGREAFEAYTDHATYKAGYLSTNTQEFVAAFEDSLYVFFVFNQQDKHPLRSRTLLARMCKQDPYYYSYLEMELQCLDPGGPPTPFSTCLAASAATAGAGKVLYAVFTREDRAGGGPRAGLCLFPLDEIHEKIKDIRNACYMGDPQSSPDDFYKPFHGEIQCGGQGLGAGESFLCGSEHLPYPLGSRKGLGICALRALSNISTRLFYEDSSGERSFVASNDESVATVGLTVATENGHTIAFLGTSDGQVLKAYLAPDGSSVEYGSILVDINKRVKQDLVLSADQASLYAMTQDKAFRLPVQECSSYLNCMQCLGSRDPYCGWCIVKGRCSRRAECPRAEESGHWLWSREESCVTVTGAQPQNMSRRAQGEVQLTISPLPALGEDKLLCLFGDSPAHPARVEGDAVVCNSPSNIPSTPSGQDHVAVEIQLRFMHTDVFLTSHQYPFYDCSEAMKLERNLPCISCASNRWTCQWDMRYHECREASPNPEDSFVPAHMEDSCPQFLNPSPLVIPMNYETDVTFQGENLDTVKVGQVCVRGPLQQRHLRMPAARHHGDPAGDRPPGRRHPLTCVSQTPAPPLLPRCLRGPHGPWWAPWSPSRAGGGVQSAVCPCVFPQLSHDESETLPLHLYVKSYGKYIDSKLGRCVYEALCSNATSECPPPVITEIQPETGPLGGGIRVTILGSNLGVRADDVKSITVAGKNCAFEPERYSVSTRIVCAIEATEAPFTGGVEVDINGKRGHSPPHVQFTYQEPQPLSVEPREGPQAGGTTLTINGTNLDTGSKEDVRVTIGGVPCNVTQFGAQLQCVTGPQAAPGQLSLEIYYGGSLVPSSGITFTYRENPVLRAFEPLRSFASGGRSINVTGQGFGLIQNFSMVVIAEPLQPWRRRREAGPLPPHTIVGTEYTRHNDSRVVFLSPAVPEDPEAYNLTALIQMDGHRVLLRTEAGAFEYVSDPTFKNFTGGVKKQVNKLIHAQGTNLNKAMTLHEAEAFVGAERCIMKTLTETDLYCEPPEVQPPPKRRQKRDTTLNLPEFIVKFGSREWVLGRVEYDSRVSEVPLSVILPLVMVPMVVIIALSVSSPDLMIEMEDQTNDVHEAGIPVLDYKTYTDRVFFLPSKDGDKDVMITGKLDIPESRRPVVEQALYQFSNLLNSKSFLINVSGEAAIRPAGTAGPLGTRPVCTPRSETVVERMLSNWMSICLYQYLKDSAGEPLYKLFKAIKHQVEKGPVDAVQKKAKYTLNDTGLLGDDVEYAPLTVSVIVQDEGGDAIPVKVLNCDTISQVKEKIIDQVYRTQPCSRWPKADSVVLGEPSALGGRAGDSEGALQGDGLWPVLELAVRDGATLILSKVGVSQQPEDSQQDLPGERHALLEDENRVWHLVRPTDEVEEGKCKRGSMKEKERTKAITEIYLTHPLLTQAEKDSPSNKLLYAKEISTYKKMVEDYYKGIRQMVQVSDQDMNTHLAEISRAHTDSLNTLVALHQLYQYTQKYYDEIINALEEDPAAQKMQLAYRLQQIAAALENKIINALEEDPAAQKMQLAYRLQQIAAALENKEAEASNGPALLARRLLAPGLAVPPAVKYFFDFLDEQAEKHDIKDEDTIHIWKTNSLPLRFWVNILKNPHFIFDVHVHEVVDASLSVIAQTFMDACTRTEHKLSRDSPSNKLLYAKEISTYKKMVEE